MKSFKRVFLSLCVCLLAVATFFGCTFITVNDKEYYNITLASVELTDGTVLKVNIKEVLDGLTNFGYSNYFQNVSDDDGYIEGVKQTVIALLSRKTILHIINNERDAAGNLVYTLDDYDKKTAMKNAIDSINDTIETNEQTIRERRDLDEKIDESESSNDTDTKREYSPYDKHVIKSDVNGDGIIEPDEFTHVVVPKKKNNESILAMDLNKSLLENFRFTSSGNDVDADPEDKQIFFEARFELFKSLRAYYGSFEDTAYTDNQLLEMHLQSVYESNIEDAKIEKMQELYEKTQTEGANAFIQINSQIVQLFKQRYVLAKNRFQSPATVENYKAELKTNSISGESYYVPVTNEYFLVQHILLKFSDEQSKLMNEQKTKLDQGYIEQEDYDAYVDSLAQQIEVNGKHWTAIRDEINSYCGTATTDALGIQAKARLFRDKMFEYTGDDGTLNAEGDYIIPTKRYKHGGTAGADEDLLDSMVESFANTSRQIRLECMNEGLGRVGKISEPVLTEFGWHIIMYVGEYDNSKFSSVNIEALDITDENNIINITNILYNTYIKAGHNKTYYDSLYENVTLNNFGTMATSLINSSQKETTWETPIIKDIITRFIK